MSSKDAIEYLYTVLRMNRADEQMYDQGFLSAEDYRKIWEVIVHLESRHTIPRIYPAPRYP
jgi:hypothetical protein